MQSMTDLTDPTDYFVAGGTLRPRAPSYVTRPADADLLRHLQAGEFCYVLTPRQMGKSSLMVRTAQRLQAEGVQTAIVDLTGIGAGSGALSVDEWYLGLLSRLRSELRLTVEPQSWWQERAALGAAPRFTDFLRDVVLAQCQGRVVILIDEIDATLNLHFRDDFFAAIRALYNERAANPDYNRLTFALFGVATPTDLIQERARTPFNIGQRIELVEFTQDDAQPLAAGLESALPGQGDSLLANIFAWTNGHPYLTQRLCATLVGQDSILSATTHSNDQIIDDLVDQLFLSEQGRKDPNLTFVQDRIAASAPPERRAMLQLYGRVRAGERVADDDRSTIQNRLELVGLLGVRQGVLHVRNPIYERVFDNSWIAAMTPPNRQRRVALLAALVAVLLVALVGYYLSQQEAPGCATYAQNFNENTESDIRLNALSDLLDGGCADVAYTLFYSLNPGEQLAIFGGLTDYPGERPRLVNVIGQFHRTLDTTPAQDLALMDTWLYALERAGLGSEERLMATLRNWQNGRELYAAGDLEAAAAALREAQGNAPDHPIIHFDRAQVLIDVGDYEGALDDLAAMMEIASNATPTPTPTGPTATPTATATSIPTITPTEPTPTRTPTITPSPTMIYMLLPGLDSPLSPLPTPSMLFIPTTVSAVAPPISPLTTDSEKPRTSHFIDRISTVDYLQRFKDTDFISTLVKQVVEGHPQVGAYLILNSTQYPSMQFILNTVLDEFAPFRYTNGLLEKEAQLIHQANLARVQEGAPPLRWNSELSSVARWFAYHSVQDHDSYCGHEDLVYGTIEDRIKGVGYVNGQAWGENVSCSYADPNAVIESFLRSDGHRENLLNPIYRETGVGYYKHETDSRGYVVQVLTYDQSYAPVIIENEAVTTTNSDITLYIFSHEQHDGFGGYEPATEMMIANEPNFVNSRWEPFSNEKRWSLGTGTGWRTVYVKTRDVLGRSSLAYDTIYLGADPSAENYTLNKLATSVQTRFDYKNIIIQESAHIADWSHVQFSPNWLADDTMSTFELLDGDGERVNDAAAIGGQSFRLKDQSYARAWVWSGKFTPAGKLVAYARLKVANNQSESTAVSMRINVDEQSFGPLEVRASDFVNPNQYQEFMLPFEVNGNSEVVVIYFEHFGVTDVYIDAVTFYTENFPLNDRLIWVPPDKQRSRTLWTRFTNDDHEFSQGIEIVNDPLSQFTLLKQSP